jgi:RND superfamily putative drug exporter
MREAYVHGDDPKQAIVTGFGHSGRVVTAAAIIMTSVFAAFLLDPSAIVKSIAVALAFGVLIDAFVVRMTLVPAVMALMGKAAWWLPKGVDKRLPDIDIEGNKLLDGLRDAPNPV